MFEKEDIILDPRTDEIGKLLIELCNRTAEEQEDMPLSTCVS